MNPRKLPAVEILLGKHREVNDDAKEGQQASCAAQRRNLAGRFQSGIVIAQSVSENHGGKALADLATL